MPGVQMRGGLLVASFEWDADTPLGKPLGVPLVTQPGLGVSGGGVVWERLRPRLSVSLASRRTVREP